MPEESRLYASVRGGANDGEQRFIEANQSRELLVAQGFPRYTELSRRGYGWQVMDTSATAAVVVRPSTVAGLTLWNGEAASTGKVYVIDRVGAFNLVTTDAVHAWSLWGCLHPSMVAPTADITAIKGYAGGTYSGLASVDTGATVLDSGWFILSTFGVVGNPGTTTPGNALVFDTDGRFIVKPGAGFSINVVASLTGDTFTHMISWFEVPPGFLTVD